MLSCQGCRVVTHAVINLASSLPGGARPGSARKCVGDLCGPLRRWLPWRQALGAACIHNGRAVEAERGSNPEGGFLREQLSHVGGVGMGGGAGQSRHIWNGQPCRHSAGSRWLTRIRSRRSSGIPAALPASVIGFKCFVSLCGVSFFPSFVLTFFF